MALLLFVVVVVVLEVYNQATAFERYIPVVVFTHPKAAPTAVMIREPTTPARVPSTLTAPSVPTTTRKNKKELEGNILCI